MTVGPTWDTATAEERGVADSGDEQTDTASLDAPYCIWCGGILLRNVTGERVLRCPSCCREPAPSACAGCVAQRADNAALVAEVERLRSQRATLLAAYDAQRAVLIAVRQRAAKEYAKPAVQRETWDACEESAAVRAIREAMR